MKYTFAIDDYNLYWMSSNCILVVKFVKSNHIPTKINFASHNRIKSAITKCVHSDLISVHI